MMLSNLFLAAGANNVLDSTADAALAAVTGYAVVFSGIVILMVAMMIMSKLVMLCQRKPASVEAPAAKAAPAADAPTAPGSAGQLKLYNTDPKTAAMLMAIVADKMGKPINELRFISIKEVK